jgi:hypothetical protein
MVTMPLDDVAVAEQLVKPLGSVMVGLAVTVKRGLNVTVMVLPTPRAPVDEVVKPSVHVVLAPAVCKVPVKDTFVGDVTGVIVTPAPGLAAVTSWEVEILKLVAG